MKLGTKNSTLVFFQKYMAYECVTVFLGRYEAYKSVLKLKMVIKSN